MTTKNTILKRLSEREQDYLDRGDKAVENGETKNGWEYLHKAQAIMEMRLIVMGVKENE